MYPFQSYTHKPIDEDLEYIHLKTLKQMEFKEALKTLPLSPPSPHIHALRSPKHLIPCGYDITQGKPVISGEWGLKTPEQKARDVIDKLLIDAGWTLQNPDEFDRNAALGVAVREFQLPAGPCDYLLFGLV